MHKICEKIKNIVLKDILKHLNKWKIYYAHGNVNIV